MCYWYDAREGRRDGGIGIHSMHGWFDWTGLRWAVGGMAKNSSLGVGGTGFPVLCLGGVFESNV